MNRRSFLKGLAAASVAVQCPWPLLPQLPAASDVTWFVEEMDFGYVTAVAAQVGQAVKYRHAVLMHSTGDKEADVAFLKGELIKLMRHKGWLV